MSNSASLATVVLLFLTLSTAFNTRLPPLTKSTVAGVWKLEEKTIASKRHHFFNKHWASGSKQLLSLSPNGQFSVVSEDSRDEDLKGVWEVLDNKLVLAHPNRFKREMIVYVSDIEFVSIDEQTFKLSTANARIGQGKTIYPSSHPRFFDNIFFDNPSQADGCEVTNAWEEIDFTKFEGSSPWSISKSFDLEQILGKGLIGETKEDRELEKRFEVSDLGGRDFFLITMPLKQRLKKFASYAEERLHKKKQQQQQSQSQSQQPTANSFTDDVTER